LDVLIPPFRLLRYYAKRSQRAIDMLADKRCKCRVGEDLRNYYHDSPRPLTGQARQSSRKAGLSVDFVSKIII
jgi:hypothetical protein